MQSKEDEILQKRCFACRQYLPNPVNDDHLKSCLTNVSLQKQIECKGCYCLVEVVKLFKHLNHKTVKCKASYTEAEIIAVEKLCNPKSKEDLQDDLPKNQEKDEIQPPALTECKGCHKQFSRILGHIGQNKKCKNSYGEEDLKQLKEDAKSERQKYKNVWKRQKSTSEKEYKMCEVCKETFLNLKQHLNRTPDCQNKYDKEQLSCLNKEIEEQSKKRKRTNNAEYQKNHPPDEEKKEEKAFDDKLRYKLFERTGIEVKRLKNVLTNKVALKNKQYHCLKATVLTSLQLKIDKDQPVFKKINTALENVEAIQQGLMETIDQAITYLEEGRRKPGSRSMPNNEACIDVMEPLNDYVTGKFKIIQQFLNNISEYLESVSNIQVIIPIETVHEFQKNFKESHIRITGQYLQKFCDAKEKHTKRLKLWNLVQQKSNQDIFKKFQDTMLTQVKCNLENYSSWIPKYKLKIEEYRMEEGLSKDKKDNLAYYENSFQKSFEKTKEEIEEFLARSYKVQVSNYETKNKTESVFKKYNDLVWKSKLQMEKCEDLSRYDLYHLLVMLKSEFGHKPSFTKKEIELKFGLDPDLDCLGKGKEKYLRGDQNKAMLHERLHRETYEYLMEWFENLK